MKKTTHFAKWIFLAAATVGGIGLMACHHSPEDHVDHAARYIANELDLNDQQKTLLADIVSDIKADIKNHQDKAPQMKDDAIKLIQAPELDTNKIKGLVQDFRSAQDQKIDKYLPKIAALHKTLSDKQKATLVEKINKFHEHFM